MPISVTYPGVYVEELPSATWATDPVPTSITAFVGRTRWGPEQQPISVTSFEEFTHHFGGLHNNCPMTYSVHHFFENGGAEAIIVRLFEPAKDDEAKDDDGYAQLQCGEGLVLRAASPGSMGNRLTASIDRLGITERSAAQFAGYGLKAADLFHLSIELRDEDGDVITSERFLNLSIKRSGAAKHFPNSIDRALDATSELVREFAHCKNPPPNAAKIDASGGSDGTFLSRKTYLGSAKKRSGLHALDPVPMFNLMCIPPDQRVNPDAPDADQDLDAKVRVAAAKYCAERRAFFIVDPPAEWSRLAHQGKFEKIDAEALGVFGQTDTGEEIDRNAAIYFPRINAVDPLDKDALALFAPSGAIAGRIAATDAADGVWRAAAGMSAGLVGAASIELAVPEEDIGRLTHLGINCLCEFPSIGPVIWGARTMRGTDGFEDEYQYISIRRLTLYIQESITRSLTSAAFEPNNEALWESISASTTIFLDGLEKQGAIFHFRVTCDATTTTAYEVARGVVVMTVAFDPDGTENLLVLEFEQAAAPPVTEKA